MTSFISVSVTPKPCRRTFKKFGVDAIPCPDDPEASEKLTWILRGEKCSKS